MAVRVYHEERRDEVAKLARERAGNERRLVDLSGQLDRLMQALACGVLPIEAGEARYKPLETERDRVAAELAQMPTAPVLELHSHAANQHRKAVEDLAARLNELDPKVDSGTLNEFRSLVDSVVVHNRKDGGVEIEVIGHLSALIGAKAELLGERLVAEDRYTRNTHTEIIKYRFSAVR